MSEALSYLYEIYDGMLDLMFNRFYMFTNVSVGWVSITVVIFSIVIRSIINGPRSVRFPRSLSAYSGGKKNGR